MNGGTMASRALVDTRMPVETETPRRPSVETSPRIRIVRVLTWGVGGGLVLGLGIWLVPDLLQKPPQNFIQASGRIEGREITLAPKEIQGRVRTLLVDEGYKVQRGQLLAEL